MLLRQALIGWQIKENGSSWVDRRRDINKPIATLNQQVLVNLIGNVLQTCPGKQGGHCHKIIQLNTGGSLSGENSKAASFGDIITAFRTSWEAFQQHLHWQAIIAGTQKLVDLNSYTSVS